MSVSIRRERASCSTVCAGMSGVCLSVCPLIVRSGGRGGWVRSAAVRGAVCVGAVFSVRCAGTEVTHQLTDPRIKNGLDLVSQVLPSDILLKILIILKEQTLQLCLTE